MTNIFDKLHDIVNLPEDEIQQAVNELEQQCIEWENTEVQVSFTNKEAGSIYCAILNYIDIIKQHEPCDENYCNYLINILCKMDKVCGGQSDYTRGISHGK